MLKCIAYCRVSKDSKDQLNSLKNQIEHYKQLFEKEGFQGADCGVYYSKEGKAEAFSSLKSIFADEGISGTKLKNRGAFKRMLECAFKKEFDIIYVKNIQRFARNVEDGSGILKRLKVAGVKVVFEDGNLNNFDNEMVINVLLSAAQEESRAKGRAVQFSIYMAQKEGKWTAGVPYGYYKENANLKPIPEQLNVVREIFSRYTSGFGGNSIAKHLNEAGYLTQKGLPWYHSLIYDIIQNPIYIGRQITHRFQNTDINIDSLIYNGLKFSSQKDIDESEWITTIREDLRAVSDDVFNAAQDEYKKRVEINGQKGRPSTKHLFSNLLYCHACNKAMRRKKLWGWMRLDGTRNMGVEWVCVSHDMRHDKGCPFRNSWHEDALYEKVKQEICRVKANKNILQQQFEEYLNSFITNEQVSEKSILIKADLDEVNDIITTNLLLLTRKIISEEQYKDQNASLQTKKKELEAEQFRYESLQIEQENARRKHDGFLKYLDSVDVDALDNSILKKLLSHIEAYTIYNDNGAEIKDLYFVWNVIDKTEDDILLKKAIESLKYEKVSGT